MKNVILVLSTSGTPEEVVDYAIERAKKDNAGIVALYVLDTDLSSGVFDSFTDIGFIGDRPSTELSEALMKEYRQRGYEEIGKVQIKAMEQAVDFEPLMEQGPFVDIILGVIESKNAMLAVLVKRKKKDFMKYFSTSLADEVREKAKCEVVVFREDA